MNAEMRRLPSADRLLQADAIADGYLRNLFVFYIGVALIYVAGGINTANFAIWNIDILCHGNDSQASTYYETLPMSAGQPLVQLVK